MRTDRSGQCSPASIGVDCRRKCLSRVDETTWRSTEDADWQRWPKMRTFIAVNDRPL